MNAEFRSLVASLVRESMDGEASSAAIDKVISLLSSLDVWKDEDGDLVVNMNGYDIDISLFFNSDGETDGTLIVAPEDLSVDDKIYGRNLYVELFK